MTEADLAFNEKGNVCLEKVTFDTVLVGVDAKKIFTFFPIDLLTTSYKGECPVNKEIKRLLVEEEKYYLPVRQVLMKKLMKKHMRFVDHRITFKVGYKALEELQKREQSRAIAPQTLVSTQLNCV